MPKPKYIQVLLSDELRDRLEADAKADGRTNSNYAARIIEAHYNAPLTGKKWGKRKPPPFSEGDTVTIPSHLYVPGMRAIVMATSGKWAMLRRADNPRAMPFTEYVKNLVKAEETQPQ